MSVRTSASTGKPAAAEQPAHDAIATFVQHHPHQGLARNGVHHREFVDARRAVVQFDSRLQPLAQPTRHRPGHRGQIRLGHLVGRMHQPVRQLAVVGQQDQPLGVGVQPPDVKEVLVAAHPVFHQVADARPAPVVRHGRMHAPRLVQRQVHQRLVEDHPAPSTRITDAAGIHPGAQFGHHLPVDLDAAVDDQLLGDPPRRNSRLGQHLLQANPFSLDHQSWSTSNDKACSGA